MYQMVLNQFQLANINFVTDFIIYSSQLIDWTQYFGQLKIDLQLCNYINLSIIILGRVSQPMSWICCSTPTHTTGFSLSDNSNNNSNQIATQSHPQPIKFKLFKSLNLLSPMLKLLMLPKKKQAYTFNRDNLHFLSYTPSSSSSSSSSSPSHIPVLYFPSIHPNNETIFIYNHGSGSTLNNLYNFALHVLHKYGVSVLVYDYTGQGESQGQFLSYEQDIKAVLAWVVGRGYRLTNVVLCGFSIGSYTVLAIGGQMARVLISPICGLIPFIEGTNVKYQGEIFDNLKNAQKIQARTLILHGSKQMIPYSHAQAIVESLKTKNSPQKIQLYKVDGVNHLDMPNVILKKQFSQFMTDFIKKVKNEVSRQKINKETESLSDQLKIIVNHLTQARGNTKISSPEEAIKK